MTKYTATFSNGATHMIKNSKREYTHAWCWAPDEGEPVYTGISSSFELAEKAMRADIACMFKKWDSKKRKWVKVTPEIYFSEIVEVVKG